VQPNALPVGLLVMLNQAILMTIAALALSACTGRTSPAQVRTETGATPARLSLLTLPPSATRMEAALSGVLLLESGCAQVARSSGTVSVVWSGSPSVDPAGAILYAGRRFVHGDRVRFGGGFITPADPDLERQIATSRCAGPYFLVQSIEESRP
jgi:hypothetical protein